jgi:2-amino-4-hydroxy-6-hydroxymethyldihydropteridine diphosphokinase
MNDHILYLLLGSNLGKKKNQLDLAIDLIAEEIGKVVKQSSFYETQPWGFISEDVFLNIALKILTPLTPNEVMKKINVIENTFGRERLTTGYSSRPMDIDILFYDDLVLTEESLIIPHPRIHERKFALIPLLEIAPALIHPLLGKSITALLAECQDTKTVTPHPIPNTHLNLNT